ncbi:MAG: hypothetical protein KDN19_18250 [Verrucomicrobiae bacterium]|nr:hypothetical protein [Verrucomicrobiae bacterium]
MSDRFSRARRRWASWLWFSLAFACHVNVRAQEAPAPGPYTIDLLPVPDAANGQVAAIDFDRQGDTVVLARDGRVWIQEKAQETWRQWSDQGLAGATGLFAGYLPKSIYVVHATGISRLFDTDENGDADFVKAVIPSWRFGTLGELFRKSPTVLPDGDLLMSPNVLTGTWSGLVMRVPEAKPVSTWMGGFARVTAPAAGPDGTWMLAGTTRISDPNNADSETGGAAIWIVDSPAETPAEPAPAVEDAGKPADTGEKKDVEENPDPAPETEPAPASTPKPLPTPSPAIFLPTSLMTTSPLRPAFPEFAKADSFGVFSGQGFVAGENSQRLLRIMPEKIGDTWQGAVTNFAAIESTEAGIEFLAYSPEGDSLFAGEGGQALRIRPAGGAIYAVRSIHLAGDGFEVSFTRPIDRARAIDLSNWDIRHGSPDASEKAMQTLTLPDDTRVIIDFDGLAATLQIPNLSALKTGMVYVFDFSRIPSESGESLSHEPVFYTLNAIPKGRPESVGKRESDAAESDTEKTPPEPETEPVKAKAETKPGQ